MKKKKLKDKLSAKRAAKESKYNPVKEAKPLNFKKISIQWFDKELRLLDEKTAVQDPFIYARHKLEPHDGPLRVTFSMEDQNDVAKAAEFIQQLSGILPMNVKKVGKTIGNQTEYTEDSRDEIIDMVKSCASISQAKDNLSNIGFNFISNEFIEAMSLPFNPVKDDHEYTWMMLKIKESKVNPLSDKYDPTLVFGFNIDNPTDSIPYYLYNKKQLSVTGLELPKANIKVEEYIKYPKYITHDERLKLSAEVRQLTTGSKKVPSKLIKRWFDYIIFPEKIREKLLNEFPEHFNIESTDE